MSLHTYLPIFLQVYTRHLFTSTRCRGLTRMLKSLIDFEKGRDRGLTRKGLNSKGLTRKIPTI
jgi:hypothetical protein